MLPSNQGVPYFSWSFRATFNSAFEQTIMFTFGPVHRLHLAEPRVARERAEDPQAELVEQGRDVPELAGDVVLADQVHVVHPDARRAATSGSGSGSRVPITYLTIASPAIRLPRFFVP